MTSESGNKLFGIHSNLHTSIVEHAKKNLKNIKEMTIVMIQILKEFCDFNICNMYYIY